jgi:phage terminase large subunit
MPGFLPMATLGALELKAEWKKWLVASYAAVPTDSADLDKLARNLLPWAQPLLEPRRYKCLWGGRGSGKSTAAADALLIEGARRKCRVLCAREFQNSLAESVHQLLCDRIEALGLQDCYRILDSEIRGPRGTQFFFKGLRHNVRSLKSIAGITHVWVEEAQTISQESWDILTPTVRASGSEIWVTFNPEQESDTIYQRFVVNAEASDYVCRVNWDQNPYFTPELEDERQRMLRTDPDRYDNIWEGNPIRFSKAQVFHGKWVVDEFEPGDDWQGPYFGADWGFGPDPTAAIKCWIHERQLYIERESYAYDLALDEIATIWKVDIPGIATYPVRADNSRPETIKHVRGKGIAGLIAADKWPNSIKDGIEYLRSFDKIIIHPRCKNLKFEAMNYKRKVDPHTQDVLPIIIDKHQHLWDSLRYALDALIQNRSTPFEYRTAKAKRVASPKLGY